MTVELRIMGLVGTGKRTLMGNIVSQCGLNLATVGILEANGKTKYPQIVEHYEDKKLDLEFYIPKGRARFSDASTPDIALLVIDASNLSNEQNSRTSSSSTAPSIAEYATESDVEVLATASRVLIVVNKMDKVQWQQSIYNKLVTDVTKALRSSGMLDSRISSIPISAIKGDNITELYKKSTWYHHGENFGSLLTKLVIEQVPP